MNKNNINWNKKYKELKQFVKENNRLPVQRENTWLNSQRNSYKNNTLSKERIDLLLKIDENIFENVIDLNWIQKYEELKQFVKENNRLPVQRKNRWLNHQRNLYNNNALSKERIDLLLKIDENIFENVIDLNWNQKYEELKQFVKENNRLPIYRENTWFIRQKSLYENNTLSEVKKNKIKQFIKHKKLRKYKLTIKQEFILNKLNKGYSQTEISILLENKKIKGHSTSSIEKELKKIKKILGANSYFQLGFKYKEYKDDK